MTFLAIVAIGGIAVPLGDRSFLGYARAARASAGCVGGCSTAAAGRAVSSDATARGVRRLAGVVWEMGTSCLPAGMVRLELWGAELAMLGAGGRMSDGVADGGLLPSGYAVCSAANMVSIPLIAVLAPMGVMTFVSALVGTGWRCCRVRRRRCCCMG